MDSKTKREFLAKTGYIENALNRMVDELAFMNNVLDTDLRQENESLQKMIDNSSAIVADCAMLVGAMRELCYEIEKCGASEQLTNTVVLASEITNELKYITGGVAVEHRVHPTSEILRRLREVSTTKPDTDLKPGSSPLTCG